MKELIEQLRAGVDLTPSEIRVAANFLADTGSPDGEQTELLAALRDKGESGEEVGYFAEAFLNLAVTPSANLNGKPSIDLCGTGGDRLELINVSTTAMFIVAAGGAAGGSGEGWLSKPGGCGPR